MEKKEKKYLNCTRLSERLCSQLEGYALYDSCCMTLWKRPHSGHSKKKGGCWVLGGGGDERAEHRGLLGQWDCSVWHYKGQYIHLSRSTGYHTEMNPKVNCGLGVITMCQCPISPSKCAIWRGCWRRSKLCMCGAQGIQKISGLPLQFCCEPKTARKIMVLKKKKIEVNYPLPCYPTKQTGEKKRPSIHLYLVKISQATSSLTNLLETPSYKVTRFFVRHLLLSDYMQVGLWGRPCPLKKHTHWTPPSIDVEKGAVKHWCDIRKWQDRKENAVTLSTVPAEPFSPLCLF